MAIVALVLGIISFLGLFFIGGIGAIATGHLARRENGEHVLHSGRWRPRPRSLPTSRPGLRQLTANSPENRGRISGWVE